MHAAAAVESALIIDKLFSRSLSGPAHFWAGVLCGRYHSVRKGGGGDGSLIFVKASGPGYLRPRNQGSSGSLYINPLKEPPGLIQEMMCLVKVGTAGFHSRKAVFVK
jgi:hypothetical protein